MTRRVCVIGNSHIASLKRAELDGLVRAESNRDELEFVFWGLAGSAYSTISFENGRLVTTNEAFVGHLTGGLHLSIDPNAFDAMLFHGPGIPYTRLIEDLRGCGSDLRRYSSASLGAAFASWAERNFTFGLMAKVRAATGIPILISPMPLIAQASGRFAEVEVRPEEIAYLNQALADLARDRGLEFLPQPPGTITQNKYTRDDLSVGSVTLGGNLTGEHDPADHQHMNARYGAAVLAALSDQLTPSSG